jgi:hypothetical protein
MFKWPGLVEALSMYDVAFTSEGRKVPHDRFGPFV